MIVTRKMTELAWDFIQSLPRMDQQGRRGTGEKEKHYTQLVHTKSNSFKNQLLGLKRIWDWLATCHARWVSLWWPLISCQVSGEIPQCRTAWVRQEALLGGVLLRSSREEQEASVLLSAHREELWAGCSAGWMMEPPPEAAWEENIFLSASGSLVGSESSIGKDRLVA